jgi:hypothetical protein
MTASILAINSRDSAMAFSVPALISANPTRARRMKSAHSCRLSAAARISWLRCLRNGASHEYDGHAGHLLERIRAYLGGANALLDAHAHDGAYLLAGVVRDQIGGGYRKPLFGGLDLYGDYG